MSIICFYLFRIRLFVISDVHSTNKDFINSFHRRRFCHWKYTRESVTLFTRVSCLDSLSLKSRFVYMIKFVHYCDWILQKTGWL